MDYFSKTTFDRLLEMAPAGETGFGGREYQHGAPYDDDTVMARETDVDKITPTHLRIMWNELDTYTDKILNIVGQFNTFAGLKDTETLASEWYRMLEEVPGSELSKSNICQAMTKKNIDFFSQFLVYNDRNTRIRQMESMIEDGKPPVLLHARIGDGEVHEDGVHTMDVLYELRDGSGQKSGDPMHRIFNERSTISFYLKADTPRTYPHLGPELSMSSFERHGPQPGRTGSGRPSDIPRPIKHPQLGPFTYSAYILNHGMGKFKPHPVVFRTLQNGSLGKTAESWEGVAYQAAYLCVKILDFYWEMSPKDGAPVCIDKQSYRTLYHRLLEQLFGLDVVVICQDWVKDREQQLKEWSRHVLGSQFRRWEDQFAPQEPEEYETDIVPPSNITGTNDKVGGQLSSFADTMRLSG